MDMPPPPPVPAIPEFLLSRHGARMLDPDTAVQPPGATVNPTIYLARRLLVRGLPDGSASRIVERLQTWSDERDLGLRWTVAPGHRAAIKDVDPHEHKMWEQVMYTAVDIAAAGDSPAAPPDAWTLLQQLRHDLRDEPEIADQVALDHLMAAGGPRQGGIWGGVGGIWAGVGGIWAGVGGSAAPSMAGYTGRTPVVWSAPDPWATTPRTKYEPVVAVVDSGIGQHPWFATEGQGFSRYRGPGVDQTVLDHLDHPDSTFTGVVTDPLNGVIDALAGHGTFVAGVVRQRCARAHLLDVPVMAADGVVAESDVLLALAGLLRLHRREEIPTGAGAESRRLDVLNLSMGYYHESPDDPRAAAPLSGLLRSFADSGVVVVAAAGNGATTVPFYPAGLSSQLTEPLPLISVGALNPDDHTVAVFSNNGDWVTTHAPGAAVVSTVPVGLTGSFRRGIAVQRDDPMMRGTIDPDDFGSGFAIWSGTSFAAPWVAGDIATWACRTGDVPAAVKAVLTERDEHVAAIRRRSAAS